MGTLRHSLILRRGSLIMLLLLGFAIGMANAQEKTIKGKVTSEAEGPLPGVNIQVQGTMKGTITDMDGNYSISVLGPQAVLVFSFVSYTSQTVTVGDQTTLDVVLVSTATSLGEVVVVGYGTQKKREVTSAISSVKSEEFNKGNVENPVQLIQGKVSGLAISKPGSNPNGSYDIRLRGLSTIGANLGPLVVIDGVVGGTLDNVDPNDIESINVLKDGSGAAIYGTRGSSGVILVTTKKGKSGISSVEYNGYVTGEFVAKNTDVMDASQWRKLSTELGKGVDGGASTNWFKEIEQTGITQVHNISLSGGTDKTTYRASVNYHNGQGIEKKTGFSQFNGRINLTQKALNDKLVIDMNLGATQRQSQVGFDAAFRYATIYNPTSPVMADPSSQTYDQYQGYFQSEQFDYYNPVSILNLNKNETDNRIWNASIKGTFEIVKGLNIDAFYALQSSAKLEGIYNDKNDYWGGYGRHGLASRKDDASNNRLFEATAHYLGDIGPVNLSVLGGYSYQDFVNEGFEAEGGDFLTDDFTFNNLNAAQDFNNGKGTVTSYKNSNKLIAFFGRLNFSINSMYFLSASARYEGSSRFGANNKWGVFPAIGGGVDLSKLINVSLIDNLKIRASYGVTGAQPKDSYLSQARYGPSGYYLSQGSFHPGYHFVSNANPDLKWEKKGEFDAGFDFVLLNNRISGAFDYYTRTTTDLLFLFDVPNPPNLYNQAWVNIGEIKSSGLELTLSINAVKKANFTYNMTFTPSYSIENTLVSLSGTFNGSELNYGTKDLSDMGSPGQNQVPLVRVQEGQPIGQLLTMKFKEIDGDGNLVMVDVNKDGKVDQADRTVTGNGLPKFLMGFGNNFTYKNWDANIFFRCVTGHDLINSFRGFYEVPELITTYNLPTTAADQRNSAGVLMKNNTNILSDRHVENASFVSLDNMSVGYNFRFHSGAPVNRIRVYLAGNNLFYLTKYKGVDPNPRYIDSATDMGTFESPLVPGIDRRDTWFRTRSVTFGVNVAF